MKLKWVKFYYYTYSYILCIIFNERPYYYNLQKKKKTIYIYCVELGWLCWLRWWILYAIDVTRLCAHKSGSTPLQTRVYPTTIKRRFCTNLYDSENSEFYVANLLTYKAIKASRFSKAVQLPIEWMHTLRMFGWKKK